ncbi:hypothetical protein QX249_08770 [Vibrio parahaemolyticus]|uniref:Uncharacterized protein n=1 Tax=Vibrio parahaemolyticus TaxID=670 RepID=A0AAW8PZ93_VIBPH|nr:hypothetical protein [Vibrio parahaemolyticus]MDS1820750.1 hypothetical protein [Vibrio parahaemolyticus]
MIKEVLFNLGYWIVLGFALWFLSGSGGFAEVDVQVYGILLTTTFYGLYGLSWLIRKYTPKQGSLDDRVDALWPLYFAFLLFACFMSSFLLAYDVDLKDAQLYYELIGENSPLNSNGALWAILSTFDLYFSSITIGTWIFLILGCCVALVLLCIPSFLKVGFYAMVAYVMMLQVMFVLSTGAGLQLSKNKFYESEFHLSELVVNKYSNSCDGESFIRYDFSYSNVSVFCGDEELVSKYHYTSDLRERMENAGVKYISRYSVWYIWANKISEGDYHSYISVSKKHAPPYVTYEELSGLFYEAILQVNAPIISRQASENRRSELAPQWESRSVN